MTAQEAVAFLASKRRTVLLGGMAMILHGLSRNTKDYDIWLDPLPDAQTWAAAIQQLLRREPPLQVQRISAFGGLKHPTLFENDLKIHASCRNNRHRDYRGRRGCIHGERGNHVKIIREELQKLGRIPPSMSEFTVNVCLVSANPLK
jgi:hypothetical protein